MPEKYAKLPAIRLIELYKVHRLTKIDAPLRQATSGVNKYSVGCMGADSPLEQYQTGAKFAPSQDAYLFSEAIFGAGKYQTSLVASSAHGRRYGDVIVLEAATFASKHTPSLHPSRPSSNPGRAQGTGGPKVEVAVSFGKTARYASEGWPCLDPLVLDTRALNR